MDRIMRAAVITVVVGLMLGVFVLGLWIWFWPHG